MNGTAQQLDILDERDPLGGPFVTAILIHLTIVGVVFLYWYWLGRPREVLGDDHSGGTAVSVSVAKSIPIPRHDAPENPVAHDTKSLTPSAPAKQDTVKKELTPEKAVEIPDKMLPKKPEDRPRTKQNYLKPAPPNQIYAKTPQQLSNSMYGPPPGSAQVGVGPNTPLGDNRLGWYANLIRDRLSQNWHPSGLGTRSAPAIINFTISRDGSIRDVSIFQGSGNPAVDNTALRAVYDSNPLPALPPQIAGNTLPAQYTFQLR